MKGIRTFRRVLAILFLSILISFSAHATPVGKFSHIKGRVDITSPGQAARPAAVGDEINVGDIVRAKSASKAEITFVDGNILRLAQSTRIEISQYMVGEEETTGTLKLSRGKIQSIVKTVLGRIFGREKKNRYEVHTPTAVCGVRGTNFFTWYTKGVSGAAFEDGQGYAYSSNRPDDVRKVNKGEAMLVVSPDVPPMVKPATGIELELDLDETAPPGGGGQGGSGTDGGGPGSKWTPPAPPSIYLDIPLEGKIGFSGTLSLGFLDHGTFSGSVDKTTGRGTVSLSGNFSEEPSGTDTGNMGGTMTDGSAFEGFLGSAIGSYKGVFSNIYLTPAGGAGYLYGALSGDLNLVENTLSASGNAYRSDVFGNLDLGGNTPSDNLSKLGDLDEDILPILGAVNAGGGLKGADFSANIQSAGLDTASGTKLGVWGVNTMGGEYSNEGRMSSWSAVYGEKGSYYYSLGTLSGADDLAGHLGISGNLTYLDEEYLGTMYLWNRGTYQVPAEEGPMLYLDYQSAGAGTLTLDPLAYSGNWGSGFKGDALTESCLYYNEGGIMTWAGSDPGLLGGLTAPWAAGTSPFFAMGEYNDNGPGGTYLWNTTIAGWGNADDLSGFEGYSAGFRRNTAPSETSADYGTMQGVAYAAYMDAAGNAGFLTVPDLSGYFYPGIDMWSAGGTWTRRFMQSVSNPSDYETYPGYMTAGLIGSFGASLSVLGAGSGESLFFKDYVKLQSLPWGIYNLELGSPNTFSEKPTGVATWSALVMGKGAFGFDADLGEDDGYWLGFVDGSWSADGEITGELEGAYLTETQIGTMAGPFFGLYTDLGEGTGTWIGESVGTYEGEPLAFSAWWGGDCLHYNDSGYVSHAGYDEGLIGFATAPWDGAASFLAMGEATFYGEYPERNTYLWNSDVYRSYGDDGIDYSKPQLSGYSGGLWNRIPDSRAGMMDGTLAAIYVGPPDPVTGLSAAGLLTGDALGAFLEMLYSDGSLVGGMWMAEGTVTPKEKTTSLDPDASYGFDIYSGSLYAKLAGQFTNSPGTGEIFGEEDYGETRYIYGPSEAPQPWGVYNLTLGFGNFYAGRPTDAEGFALNTDWSAVVGGQGQFGPSCGECIPGYWLATVDGTWSSEGVIKGDLAGTYLTNTHMGDIQGPFYGTNTMAGEGSGTWIGQSIGTFEGTPLAFGGYTEGELVYYSSSYINRAGYGFGFLGGTAPTLFSGTPTNVTFMGDYDDYANESGRPYLMYGSGFDFQGGSLDGTSTDNGGFFGYMVGIWRDGLINAKVRSLYVDPSAEMAGYLAGDVTGSHYPDLEMWMASGLLSSQPVESTSVDPSSLYVGGSVIKEHFEGFKGLGSFQGGGTLMSEDDLIAVGDPIHIAGHNWGVWNAAFGGTYSGQTSDSWSFKTGGYYGLEQPQYAYLWDATSNGYWLGEITGTVWGDPDIFGTYAGKAMTAENIYQFTGDILGSRIEIETGDWQAAGIGAFTRQPLLFSSDFRYVDPANPASGPFNTYRMRNGTIYEGSFGPSTYGQETEYYYDYEYFISSANGKVLYGERWLDEESPSSSSETGEIFLPGGTYYAFSHSRYPSFTPFRRTDSGVWEVGTVNPLDFSNPPDLDYAWERRWYEERPSNALDESGIITGIMGGTDDLWAVIQGDPIDVPISLMGRYVPSSWTSYGEPSLFGMEIKQSEFTAGGAYAGYLGGVIDDVEGMIYALFIADNAGGAASYKGGILEGGFAGNVYPDLGMWEASGAIYPTVMASDIQTAPDDLGSNLDEGFIAGWVAGDFGSEGSLISGELGWGNTLSITGHDDFGVFGLFFGYDNKAKNPLGSSAWSARAGGWAQFGTHAVDEGDPILETGMWLTSMNGTAANGILKADFPGHFLTYTKYGEITGKFIGSYDTANENWQAMAAGYWHNSQPLAFNGLFDGDMVRMAETSGGHWDNGDAGSYYDYSYDSGANTGWSREYDAASAYTTQIEYGPDGTFRKWRDADGALSYEEGTWAGDLLDIMASKSPDEPSEYGPEYFFRYGGWLSGVMGGLSDLWSANASARAEIRFIGEYDGYEGGAPPIFSTPIGSYNPYDGSPTIWDQADNSPNGGYYGYMAGRGFGNNTAEGMILALGLDKSGNAHLLKGNFGASLYPDLEMWDGTGSIFPMEIVPDTGYDAADLSPDFNILWTQHDEGDIVGGAPGQFTDSPDGIINWLAYQKDKAYFSYPGQTWRLGVSSLTFGGTYDPGTGTDLNQWSRVWKKWDDPSIGNAGAFVSASDAPGSWSNGLISAKGYEAWVNWEAAVTGVSGADLKGTYDPSNNTWQAVALWAFMDTATFLNLAQSPEGKLKLAEVNIPCIQVGIDTLSGVGGYGDLNVTMADTKFFAYSTGARPRIWASGNVNGHSSAGVLEIGHVVPLQGQTIPDLRADFAMRTWDAGAWTAKVMNGSGTVGGHAIGFGGAAAGTHPGDGTFSGTASGIAEPPPPVN